MGKIYIVGRGHLVDDSGEKHHKGNPIDFDNFTYLKDREKLFLEKGILVIPGKEEKKMSKDELDKNKLKEQFNELTKQRKELQKEKDDFEKIKESFYKEVEEFETKQKALKKSSKKGG
jgi:vacuolar-type H+-ATPase subunit I/STV1